ncbi:MAG: leishmanolysin-related zinc metalloendopeptidase [Thermoleophilaceae bacterium]
MARYESYRAVADKKAARDVAATNKPFTIEVRFTGGLNKRQQDAFKAAARRWTRVIVGDLPRVKVDGEVIDDVLILAGGADIDGPGGVLGQAGPSHIRPKRAGREAFLPVKGEMRFDSADLKQMEKDGTLNDVIAHEMGHVLGIGTIWKLKGLLKNVNSANPTFAGKGAIDEYRTLQGPGARRKQVPVENRGGSGTRGSHWREALFLNELMSGYVAAADNPLSRMTAASLADLGYVVDRDAAEPYSLPNVRLLAEEGLLVSHEAPIDRGFMLPNIPLTLPDDSLQ